MADGPIEVPLYSLSFLAFKAEIHERISKALPGPTFSVSSEEKAAFASALENLRNFVQANVHGLVSQKSLGKEPVFTWKGSIAERRFIAALPILEDGSISGQAKKATSMPSVLSAPANMERMVEQRAPASALNLDFLPTFGGPSPPTSAGSTPLHPQSQGVSLSQPSILRPPRPGASSASDPLNPFSNSPTAGPSERNPFNSPTSRSDAPEPFDGAPGQNPFDTISREPSAALQPILDKIPDLSFMLSDKLVEPAGTGPVVPPTNAQPRSSVDDWGDFSGQPTAVAQDVASDLKATSSVDAWGDFSSQPASLVEPASGPQKVSESRASTDDWGDFNG